MFWTSLCEIAKTQNSGNKMSDSKDSKFIDGLSDDDAVKILQHARDEQFAELLTLAIGLAARTHPEIIRNALASVFDTTAIEADTERMLKQAAHARDLLAGLRDEAEELRRQIFELRKEIDAVRYVME